MTAEEAAKLPCPACKALALEPAGPEAVICRSCCGLTFLNLPEQDGDGE